MEMDPIPMIVAASLLVLASAALSLARRRGCRNRSSTFRVTKPGWIANLRPTAPRIGRVRPLPRRGRLSRTVATILLAVTGAALGRGPPVPPASRDQPSPGAASRLESRDRFWGRARELGRAGKLVEAEAAQHSSLIITAFRVNSLHR
jgi:hypothetical protein